jgi:hypothetical protein
VLNNWGFSKLTRGDDAGAEKLFTEALTYDPGCSPPRTTWSWPRGAAQVRPAGGRDDPEPNGPNCCTPPALAAIKQGDVSVGKGLLQQAVDTHPQYFDAAARSLAALDANVKPDDGDHLPPLRRR